MGNNIFLTDRTDSYPETFSNGLSNIKDNNVNYNNIQKLSMARAVSAFDQGEPNFMQKNKLSNINTIAQKQKSKKYGKRTTMENNFSPEKLNEKLIKQNLKSVKSGSKLKMSLNKRLMDKKKSTFDLAKEINDNFNIQNYQNSTNTINQRQTQRSEPENNYKKNKNLTSSHNRQNLEKNNGFLNRKDLNKFFNKSEVDNMKSSSAINIRAEINNNFKTSDTSPYKSHSSIENLYNLGKYEPKKFNEYDIIERRISNQENDMSPKKLQMHQLNPTSIDKQIRQSLLDLEQSPNTEIYPQNRPNTSKDACNSVTFSKDITRNSLDKGYNLNYSKEKTKLESYINKMKYSKSQNLDAGGSQKNLHHKTSSNIFKNSYENLVQEKNHRNALDQMLALKPKYGSTINRESKGHGKVASEYSKKSDKPNSLNIYKNTKKNSINS